MKRLALFLCTFLFLTSASLVSAHITVSDGDVDVFVHIDPDDQPIPGEPATFFISIDDQKHTFDIKKCDCALTITQNEKKIFHQALTPTGNTYSNGVEGVVFSFPKEGIYQIAIGGVPTEKNLFQPFTINYNLRIENGQTTAEETSMHMHTSMGLHILHYALFGIAFIWAIIYGIRQEIRLRRLRRKGKE
jgi:hypothetical protein